VLVIGAVVGGGAAWWFRDGPVLNAGAFHAGTATQPGEWAHVLVPLYTASGEVKLDTVRAIDVSGGPEIQFSVVLPKPSVAGNLSTLTGGTLVSLGFSPKPVDGAAVRARTPHGPQLYLVLSMRGSKSGVIGLQSIEVKYKSLRHTRVLRASVTVCDSVAAEAITDDTTCS
jgi:hypothetical protein